ncbi:MULTISPECIES: hypothetical protein [unclassified Archaeoglobus]|jgi:hypothetical protein|uniref:hypothetical protein n=1 Tax=unclassified Archaeoglobus TaxID=2643606 RepID=UPI0025BB0519|nr:MULTISPECIES: hypothetical protein [unclassified Archaeoglobus]
MPILFCERCSKTTTWTYGDVVVCKSCGWQMSIEEFRTYRSKILRQEFQRFLQKERAKKPADYFDELMNELESTIKSNPELAEEVHRRNMMELEKLISNKGGSM